MRTSSFGILCFGMGMSCIAGQLLGNGTVRNGLVVGGEWGGMAKLGRGGDSASMYSVDVVEVVRTMSREMESGSGAAGPVTTTASAGSGNLLPTTAITAIGEGDVSRIVTKALDAETYSMKKDVLSTKTRTTALPESKRGSPTALSAKSTLTIRSDFESLKPTSTIEENIKESSDTLDAEAIQPMKSAEELPKTAAIIKGVDESQTAFEAVVTSSISSDSAGREGSLSSHLSITNPSESVEASSSKAPITISTLTESISETTASNSRTISKSGVSSTNAKPSLSIGTTKYPSTSSMTAETAISTTITSAAAEATSKSNAALSATREKTADEFDETIPSTARDGMKKSVGFVSLFDTSSGAEESVSLSTNAKEAASSSMGSSHSLKSSATRETSTGSIKITPTYNIVSTMVTLTATPTTFPDDEATTQRRTSSATAQEQRTTSSDISMTTTKWEKTVNTAAYNLLITSSGVSDDHMSGSTKTSMSWTPTKSSDVSAISKSSATTETTTWSKVRMHTASSATMQDRNATLSVSLSDGNAEEFDGPLRTSSQQSLTRSIGTTPASKIASRMVTLTTYSTSLSMTTNFVSKLSSSLSSLSSTSVTSSTTRPKMTDCVDDFDFFQMTDANLAESGTIAWYADWTSRASSGADASTFHSMGEVPYFGRVWLRNPDYNCGLELGGCTQRPSCNEILKLYPDDAEMARRVYFTMKMQATVNQVMKSYYEAIHTTQTNLASVMKKIADTTFQTPQMDDLQACQFLKTAYNNMYNLMAELAMPILNGKQGLGSDWFKAPVRSETNPSGEGVKYLQFNDPYGNENQGFMFWKGKAETAYRWWAQEALGTMAASTAMCEGLGVVNLNKGGAEEGMRNALLKISQFQRKELSQHVQSLNQGAFQGEGEMSAMAGMLGMGIWSNESSSAVDILTDPYQLEEMMTEQSKANLLSRAYLLNKCYLKCTTHPHASLLCQGYNDWEFSQKHAQKHGYPFDPNHPGPGSKMAEAERLMRICPTENKVCQVECWSQEKKGWTMPLHNIGQLGTEPLAVDIQSKMGEIYAYYKAHGNVNPHPDDVAAVKENPHAKLTGDHRGPHFWLPVCDSDQGYTHIVDFGQQKHGKSHMDQFSRSQDRRSFPISCGSYRSDQTEEFMEVMGLTNFKAKNVQWTMNPFFKNYAPLNAAVLIEAPLDNFLALCRLGLQYPQADTKDVKNGQMDIRREASQFCSPIEKETEGMPWFTANLYFCKKSEAAKRLFEIQGPSGGILGLGKVKNHRRLCERWLATQEGEQMHGMEETDASQGKDRWVGPKQNKDVSVAERHRFQHGSKGKVWHPKWRDKHDLIGSVLLGRRDALSAAEGETLHTLRHRRDETGEEDIYIYEATPVQEQRKGGEGVVQNALFQCDGKEGIDFGWHFLSLLAGRGGGKAMREAWKFLFMGHKDLRRFEAEVDFEGSENTCRYVKRRVKSRDIVRKREVGGGDEVKVEGAAGNITYTVRLDMEEVMKEEEVYWKEIEEVMKEQEDDI